VAGGPAAAATGEIRLDQRYGIEFEPASVARLCASTASDSPVRERAGYLT
jgi:hypothetical protein